jgi:hypothetical protein
MKTWIFSEPRLITPSYWVCINEDQVQVSRTNKMAFISHFCKLSDFKKALSNDLSLSIEEFPKSAAGVTTAAWEALFQSAAQIQTSSLVHDSDQHIGAPEGFVDCWNLKTVGAALLRLDVQIADMADSNYRHERCMHEAEGEEALAVLSTMNAKDSVHLIELAQQFKRDDWKTLHDIIPSSSGCTWLDRP